MLLFIKKDYIKGRGCCLNSYTPWVSRVILQYMCTYYLLLRYFGFESNLITDLRIHGDFVPISLVTQPMLQLGPNQTELRLMVSKSIFNVDSKNVNKKFLHRHS